MFKPQLGDIVKETYRSYPKMINHYLVIDLPSADAFVYKVINLDNGQVQNFNPDYARSSWKYEVVA